MAKAVIVVLSEMEEHQDLGRVVNALQTAREFKEEGDEVEVIFDGGGAISAVTIADPEHRLFPIYEELADHIGVCRYCARAFHVFEKAVALNLPFLAEYRQHPSIRRRVAEGFQVLTF